MAKENEIPNTAAERLLKNAGGKRVSEKGAFEFAKLIESIAYDISDTASSLAKHAGRRTIMTDDIKLARKK